MASQKASAALNAVKLVTPGSTIRLNTSSLSSAESCAIALAKSLAWNLEWGGLLGGYRGSKYCAPGGSVDGHAGVAPAETVTRLETKLAGVLVAVFAATPMRVSMKFGSAPPPCEAGTVLVRVTPR